MIFNSRLRKVPKNVRSQNSMEILGIKKVIINCRVVKVLKVKQMILNKILI